MVLIQDVNTGQEQDLMVEYKDNIKLIAFGNLSDGNFVADIKTLNKLEEVEKNGLKRVVVVMDTKDPEAIKKFIAANDIKIRMVFPVQDGWQKKWTGIVNRSVFIVDQQNILAHGVDVIGNESLIRETATRLASQSS